MGIVWWRVATWELRSLFYIFFISEVSSDYQRFIPASLRNCCSFLSHSLLAVAHLLRKLISYSIIPLCYGIAGFLPVFFR
jgi:hypothetical protein